MDQPDDDQPDAQDRSSLARTDKGLVIDPGVEEEFDRAILLLSQGELAEAIRGLGRVLQHLEQRLATSPQGEPGTEALQNLRGLALAFYRYCSGFAAQQGGQFGNAVEAFKSAADMFESFPADDSPAPMFVAQSRFNAIYSSGLDLARAGKRASAEERLAEATTFIYSDLLPRVEDWGPEFGGNALILLATCNSTRAMLAMVGDLVKSDYASALTFAKKIQAEYDGILSETGKLTLDPRIVSRLTLTVSASRQLVTAFETMAFAGRALERRDWAEFDEGIQLAKRRFGDAQQAYIMVRELAVYNQQISNIVDMLVEPMRRHGDEIRDLTALLDEQKRLYGALAGRAGVQVNTMAKATTDAKLEATVNTTVEVNTTIANFFRDQADGALRGFNHALLAAGSHPELDRLRTQYQALAAKPKDDPTWFGAVKSFVGDAAKVVGDLAKIASPIVSAYNVLGPLFGFPPVPIPAKAA